MTQLFNYSSSSLIARVMFLAISALLLRTTLAAPATVKVATDAAGIVSQADDPDETIPFSGSNDNVTKAPSKPSTPPAPEPAGIVSYRNCSAAKLTSKYQGASCNGLGFENCTSTYTLLNGIKSTCVYNEAAEQCRSRGPFCCHSMSTTSLCDMAYLTKKYPSQVLLCGSVIEEKKCKVSFSKVRVDGDKDVVTVCQWEKDMCKGYESSSSTVACCKAFD
mmetsp:Transcript_107105/g.190309  ORF Transcript_107105/g.190309 Transcript_107105/m.190309 type:complete len:220 (-) Transcript_107105:66-725(-)